MLKVRDNFMDFDEIKTGTPKSTMNIDTTGRVSNGDSVDLQYKNYEIHVCNVQQKGDGSNLFIGTVESFISLDDRFRTPKYRLEDGNCIFTSGDQIEFEEQNVFTCIKGA